MMDLKTRPELLALIAASVEAVKAMSPEQLEAMLKAQRESYVRAEFGWPETSVVRK